MVALVRFGINSGVVELSGVQEDLRSAAGNGLAVKVALGTACVELTSCAPNDPGKPATGGTRCVDEAGASRFANAVKGRAM